jgi:2',3'-cyclic-nucleotide 2'-phosphodiesterase (5'-nucleotidase family)
MIGLRTKIVRHTILFVPSRWLATASDNLLAETLGTFDVIIGGHSHTMVNPAVTVNGVLIAQAAGTGSGSPVHPDRPKYLGQVTVVLENDQVVEKSGQVFTFTAPVQKVGEG